MHSTFSAQLAGVLLLASSWSFGQDSLSNIQASAAMTQIQHNRDNLEVLSGILPIVKCPFCPSQYERILLTQLRDRTTTTSEFRDAAEKLGSLLVNKVIDCIHNVSRKDIQTPLTSFEGEAFATNIELLSVMRSGDALIDTFISHFPEANISKVLIQRDEETAAPKFMYKKLSSTIASGNPVIITEPMIATGGTLDMTISLLKEIGVREQNIIIASLCTAPEGLLRLNAKYPNIQVVMTVMDDNLNEKKYIVPGLGDFGDRFFGTCK
ncbi:MAG: uracil phosphoribosyltransferase [Chlamydiales bacterium]|nr:uracil phosphoribosyltransferase [Chlamydiales bacterium]